MKEAHEFIKKSKEKRRRKKLRRSKKKSKRKQQKLPKITEYLRSKSDHKQRKREPKMDLN